VHRLGAAVIALALAGGCAGSQHANRVNVLDARIDREHRPTYMGLPLATGQVILSEAPGAYSVFFSLVPDRFFTFTHAGVIVMEQGEPYVYDVSGRYKPGIDDRPTDAIVGGIRRTPLIEYCRPNLYAEIFAPPAGVDGEKVAAWVHQRFEEGIIFDAYFRWNEHETLFCTEFVELALEAGGMKQVTLVPIQKNASLRVVVEYLAVPLDTFLPAGLFADPKRYVGAIGTLGTRTAALAYFEAKREIYRRFTPDQKLGNIFISASGDMLLRPEIEAFLTQAVKLFEGARVAPREAAIATAVRALADDTFGPVISEGESKPRPAAPSAAPQSADRTARSG
jgi:hypothetical protein